MGTLFVDKLDPQSGTALEIGSSGDTVSVNTGATTNLAGNVTLGASGKTITVPAGATITNNGTQTGFGGNNTPYFKARLTATQSGIGTNNTKVAFNERVIDSDNLFDTTNHRFLPTTAGTYVFNTVQRLYSSTANTNFTCYLFKNGSINTRMVETRDSQITYSAFSCSTMATANGSSDYFEIYVNISNNNADITADPADQSWGFFEGFKLID